MPITPGTQTSSVLGVAKLSLTILGQTVTQTGGLPKPQTGGTARANPWTRVAVNTTTWTPI